MEYEVIECANSDGDINLLKCGEIFSTDGVELQINCSLCEILNSQKYYNFNEYANHLKLIHFTSPRDNDNFDLSIEVVEVEENYTSEAEDEINNTVIHKEIVADSNCYKKTENGSTLDSGEEEYSVEEIIEEIDDSEIGKSDEDNSSTPRVPVRKRQRKKTIVICEICGKSYRGEANLKYHMYSHTDDNPYGCDICGKSYRFPHNLLKHKQKHINAKPYKCKFCDNRYSAKDSLSNHETKHTGDPKKHKCNFCNKSFSTPGLLIEHTRTHTGEKPFECEYCHEGFISKQIMLLRHSPCPKYLQYPLHKCSECSAELMSKQALSNHKKLHNAEISFCEQCGKSFANRNLLSSHMKIHNHPFKCQHCDKGFPTEKLLITHNENYHNRDRPFVCDICPKTFTSPYALSKHKVTHSSRKPFKCNKCPKFFVNYESLYSHNKCHADRLPCQHCGKILNELYMKNHKCTLKQCEQ